MDKYATINKEALAVTAMPEVNTTVLQRHNWPRCMGASVAVDATELYNSEPPVLLLPAEEATEAACRFK